MLRTLQRAYRRARFGEPIVVVSGLPRSGTSMAMRMLDAGGLGVVQDGVREPDVDNPRGYYEDERVKDLANLQDKSWLTDARGRAIKIISFLLKDLPPTNNYKVLFMRRDLDEILASQNKMLAHREAGNEIGDEEMKTIWEGHLWRINWLVRHASHLDTLAIHYRKVLEDPEAEARRINEFLGGGLDVRRMAEVVDPTLYRNRSDEEAATSGS